MLQDGLSTCSLDIHVHVLGIENKHAMQMDVDELAAIFAWKKSSRRK